MRETPLTFATGRAPSLYPELWDGLEYGFSPTVGMIGPLTRGTVKSVAVKFTSAWTGNAYPNFTATVPTFNGTSQHGESAQNVDFSTCNILTLSAWVFVTAFASSGFQVYLEHSAAYSNNSGLIFGDDPGDFGTTNSGWVGIGSAGLSGSYAQFPRPSAGVWHHYLVGYDRPNSATAPIKYVYIDGVNQALITTASSNPTGNFVADKLNFGARNAGASNFANVKIGEVLFYRRFLDVRQAIDLYSGHSPFTRRRSSQFVHAAGITFDAASNSGYQAATGNITFNRTVGTGTNRYLRVEVPIIGSPGTTVLSVTDDDGGGNVAMSYIGRGSSATGAGQVEFWGLANPVSGTKSIRVILSGVLGLGAAMAGLAASYTNVHQTSPTANFNSASATNVGAADATVTITTVATGSWVVGGMATDDTAVTANQTSRNNVTGAAGSGVDEDSNGIVTPGTTASSYTNVGALATWVAGGYELRPDTASAIATYFGEDLMHNTGFSPILAM